MRCSYTYFNNISSDSGSETDSTDTRLLCDFDKHNWLVKKINTQSKMSSKFGNFKKGRNSKPATMKSPKISTIVEIEDSPPNSIAENPTDDDKNLNKDLNDLSTTDLEIILFKTKINPVDVMETPVPKAIDDTYKEISKHDHKWPYKPKLDHLPEFQDNESHAKSSTTAKETTNTVQSNLLTQTLTASDKTTDSPLTVVRNESNSIKHNLPLCALPEREKYKIHKIKPIEVKPNVDQNIIPLRQSSITLISHIANVGTQTDPVTIIQDDEKEMLQILRSKNVTVDLLVERFSTVACDVGTNTDNTDSENKQASPDTDETERLKQAVACSHLNKILLKNHSGLCRNGYPNFPVPEKIDFLAESNCTKGENLQKIVDRLRPSLGEIHNTIDQRNADEESSAIKRRRVSLPAMPNTFRNENQTSNESVTMARRPQLRVQRKPQMPTQAMYQHEQYGHHTMPEGASYVNPNIPDSRMSMPQYQFPRPQQQQVATTAEKQLSPYYNAAPRMVHPYAMQYGREHIPQYVPRNDHWNYPQQYMERQPMMQQPMPADLPHTMNVQQPIYRHANPIHVSSYTSNDWLKNNMPNNNNM